MTTSQLDRIRGCILGGALGDSIGLFTEFLSKERSQEIYGQTPRFTLLPAAHPLSPEGSKTCLMDRHRAVFEPGAWTDDTDQALLILLSFLRSGGQSINEHDFAKRIHFWIKFGLRAIGRPPLGIGHTVRSVVSAGGFVDDPVGAARRRWEDTGRHIAANGAVMRTGLIGALLFQPAHGQNGQERTFRAAIDVAATTHADPRCLVSCAIASGLVGAIVRGEIQNDYSIKSLVNDAISFLNNNYPYSNLSESHLKELQGLIWCEKLDDLKLDDPPSIGYTYKALASGIWCLRQALAKYGQHPLEDLFEDLITALTMQGGDADTNCAVAGPLLGTLFGGGDLPRHWTTGLKHRDWLVAKADAVAFLLGVGTTEDVQAYDWESDNDTLIDAGRGPMSEMELSNMSKTVQQDRIKRMEHTR